MDGLSVPEMSQSSTRPWASSEVSTPLARASRMRQSRTVVRASAPMTTPEVPRFDMRQPAMTLPVGAESTTPAPLGLLTWQSRMATEPDSRASTAVQPEPTIVQPSIATWPRGASTTGRSSLPPRRVRSVSMTASATRITAVPRRGQISALPGSPSATMVTRVRTVRFSG